jgi:hypothetical protein
MNVAALILNTALSLFALIAGLIWADQLGESNKKAAAFTVAFSMCALVVINQVLAITNYL